MAERAPNYWAFCAHPSQYRIMDAIRDCEFDSWNIKRGNVRAGDSAIIWKAKGREEQRGIVALAEVLSNPTPGLDPNRAYWVDPHQIDEPVPRVTVRYLVPPTLPLWENEQTLPVLGQLTVSRATGGTVFIVTPEQWAQVMEMVGGWPSEQEEIQSFIRGMEASQGKQRPGQGYGTNPTLRQAIERYAMQKAIEHYAQQGWQATDVSMTQSYDLFCVHHDGRQLRVEVKGTTSHGQQVLLTRNEVLHARQHFPHVALYVHAEIRIVHASPIPICMGGHPIILESWHPDEEALMPLAYTYVLPEER